MLRFKTNQNNWYLGKFIQGWLRCYYRDRRKISFSLKVEIVRFLKPRIHLSIHSAWACGPSLSQWRGAHTSEPLCMLILFGPALSHPSYPLSTNRARAQFEVPTKLGSGWAPYSFEQNRPNTCSCEANAQVALLRRRDVYLLQEEDNFIDFSLSQNHASLQ